MATLIPLRKCELAMDASGLPTTELVAAAMREVEAYVERLESQFEYSGVTLKAVEIRPVATDKLLEMLKEDGLFRLEIAAKPVLAKG